jgi:hypothetical protein
MVKHPPPQDQVRRILRGLVPEHVATYAPVPNLRRRKLAVLEGKSHASVFRFVIHFAEADRLLGEKKVAIGDIEEKYLLYRKQMAFPSAGVSGGLEGGFQEDSSLSTTNASMIANPVGAETLGDCSSTKDGLAGHKKKSAIVSSNSDAFRIPNGGAEKLCPLKPDISANSNDILKHIRVVFPEACNVLLDEYCQGGGKSNDDHFDPRWPLLTLEPSFLESKTGQDVLAILDMLSRASRDNDILLSDKDYSAIEGASFEWLEALKRLAKVRNENQVSLSLLLTVRIELAIMEMYVATNGKKAGHVDDKKADGIGNAATISFSRQNRAMQVVSRLCSAFKEFAEKEDAFAMNLLLSPAREVLKLDAESDMLAEHLVFTPITWLIRPVCGKVKSDTLSLFKLCGETFSKSLCFMIDDSIGVTITHLDVSHKNETFVDGRLESTAVVAKKSKKKKKKKVRCQLY